MIKLILVRHGNTFSVGETACQVGCKTDLDLSESGRQQARELGICLKVKEITPKAIYAGGLKRQKQTAELLAKELGYSDSNILLAEGLNEIDYGKWEGKTSEEIDTLWHNELADWSEASTWPGDIFEGSEQVILDGIKHWIAQLKEHHSTGETILAVSSGGLIRYFYSLLPSEWRKMKRDRALKSLKVRTGHFCELLIHPGEIEVISWNKSANS